MKRIILVLWLFMFVIVLSTFADEGDDTLKYFLSKSDCVASGTIISEPIGVVYEAGVVEYICDFKVTEVLKGDAMTNGVTARVVIVRFEQDASDRHPLIKKGGDCILYLKTASGSIPKLRTADFWFGVQYPNSSLMRSLKRLAT